MLKKRQDNFDQLPMFTPDSAWTPPTELPDLRRHAILSVDVETKDGGLAGGRGPGWAFGDGHVIGVAVAWQGGAIYVPIAHPDTQCFQKEQVAQWLKDIFSSHGIRVVTHHGSYDWGWMMHDFGIAFPAHLDDTEALAMMVDENRFSYRLDDICKWRGIPGKDEALLRDAAATYGISYEKVKGNLWRLPARFVGPYAEQDGRATLDLRNNLLLEVEKERTRDAYELEMELVPTVYEMRRRGIRIDLDKCDVIKKQLIAKRDQAIKEIRDQTGHTYEMGDLRRTKILEALHDDHGIVYPRTAKTGQGSFTDAWMEFHDHWLPKAVCQAQKMDAAASKFVQGFLINYAHKGRLHASINQFRGEDGGTRSHRFSYSDPPLQQMPARDEDMAAMIRGCFLSDEGMTWCAADYSQQEYRLIVHYAEQQKLPKAKEAAELYRNHPDTDFHKLVMDWTGLERKPAKNANFAKSYGAGVKKFADMIGQKEAAAAALFKLYDKEMPFVKALADKCARLADSRGYIKLIDGARCHFDLWEPAKWEEGAVWGGRTRELAEKTWPNQRLRRAGTHKAMNRLIQGSAARQTKLAMRDCAREGLVPILQMHDELDFCVTTDEQCHRIRELMATAIDSKIPFQVDVEIGDNWGEAKTPIQIDTESKKHGFTEGYKND